MEKHRQYKMTNQRSGLGGRRSVGLFLDESGEHGEGSDWLVGRDHVTRTLQEEWRTGIRLRKDTQTLA